MVYLLLYMDDMILFASIVLLLWHFIDYLCNAFAAMDLGSLMYFLSISVQRNRVLSVLDPVRR